MISKELLDEVLGVEIKEIGKLVEDILLSFRYKTHCGYINIYELAHKCKKWALSKNNLELISAITEEGAYCQIDNIVPSAIRYDINQMDTSCRTVFNSIIFDEDTEPEAIFKACDWIISKNLQRPRSTA